jgi:hypothetical protein
MDRIFSKRSLVDQPNLADGSWFCRYRVPVLATAVLMLVFDAIYACMRLGRLRVEADLRGPMTRILQILAILFTLAGIADSALAGPPPPPPPPPPPHGPPPGPGGVHGAPGPIAGAGLPVLAIGYGVYWLVRRRRKSQ